MVKRILAVLASVAMGAAGWMHAAEPPAAEFPTPEPAPAKAGEPAPDAPQSGGIKRSERTVLAALQWLARHQMDDGRWSFDRYTEKCTDKTCTGAGAVKADTGATAVALIPFLAAGQTHLSNGPFKANVAKALAWLQQSQKDDGDLRGTGTMYSHGLATLALSEAYGLSADKQIGRAAQKAVEFIEKAQHPQTGGWRYVPGQDGDTSVLGWQIDALKSAQLAGLKVSPETLKAAEKWLKSVATGEHGERFSYVPNSQPSATMTAVGLLCSQYLGIKPADARNAAGVKYLMQNAPGPEAPRNAYYWVFATEAIWCSQPGPDWDTWSRAVRRTLVDTQVKEGCAAGSWDPDKPTKDAWGSQGGRLLVTGLSARILATRHKIGLYKLDQGEGNK